MAQAMHLQGTRTRGGAWVILTALGVFFMAGGFAWFLIGPQVGWFKSVVGIPFADFKDQYPNVARHLSNNARQVGIWMIVFGGMSTAIAVAGLRSGARWAWLIGWVVVASLAVLGINYVAMGEGPAVWGPVWVLGALWGVGLLLARDPRATA